MKSSKKEINSRLKYYEVGAGDRFKCTRQCQKERVREGSKAVCHDICHHTGNKKTLFIKADSPTVQQCPRLLCIGQKVRQVAPFAAALPMATL